MPSPHRYGRQTKSPVRWDRAFLGERTTGGGEGKEADADGQKTPLTPILAQCSSGCDLPINRASSDGHESGLDARP